MGLTGLLCINQLIPATNICVAEAKGKSEITIGGYSYDEIYLDNSDAYVADFQRRYDKKKVVGHGYTKNNCHAYTWIGDHRYWLNVVGSFITDGSYRAVAKGNLPQKYQKIINDKGDHSGIVIGRGNTGKAIIETKTGGSPVYQNDIGDEFGSTSEYTVYERNSVC